MVLVEVVDILAADDIDLGIPIAIQTVEGSELLLLLVGELVARSGCGTRAGPAD